MPTSELQLWAVIAAPSVLVLVGILLNQAGINRLDHRMDRFQDHVDKRFDGVDKKFDGVDKKFDAVNARIDAVNARIDRVIETLLSMIADHSERLARLEERSNE